MYTIELLTLMASVSLLALIVHHLYVKVKV